MNILSAPLLLNTLAGVMLLSLSGITQAGSEIESLSDGLRDLLRKEMIAIEAGMASMVPAYVRGDYDTIADIAQKIRNSYIQRQEITQEQMLELKNKLPAAFTEKDKQFHRLAAMLQRAAEDKNMDSVSYHHARLMEACVSCHREYALHRFPGLKYLPEADLSH